MDRLATSGWRWLGVAVLGLAVRIGALLVFGPHIGGDTLGYQVGAEGLVAGGLPAVLRLRLEAAPLYIMFLALGLMIPSLGFVWFAMLGQVVFGAGAALAVMAFTQRGSGSARAGLFAGVLAAIHPTFVFWGTYVLSDTLFLLVLAVASVGLMWVAESPHPLRSSLVAAFPLIASVLARPTAAPLLLLVPIYLAVASRGRLERFGRMLAGVALPFVVVVLVLAAQGAARGAIPLWDSGQQAVSWARTTVDIGLIWTEQGRATNGVDLGVDPPPVLQTLSPSEQAEFQAEGAEAFTVRHPGFFVLQSLRKLKMFWTPVLPEYSRPHAVGNLAYFGPLFALAILGAAVSMRRPPFLALAAIGMAAFTLTSVITFVDYDQRYRLPADLFVVALAAVGASYLVGRLAKERG